MWECENKTMINIEKSKITFGAGERSVLQIDGDRIVLDNYFVV